MTHNHSNKGGGSWLSDNNLTEKHEETLDELWSPLVWVPGRGLVDRREYEREMTTRSSQNTGPVFLGWDMAARSERSHGGRS